MSYNHSTARFRCFYYLFINSHVGCLIQIIMRSLSLIHSHALEKCYATRTLNKRFSLKVLFITENVSARMHPCSFIRYCCFTRKSIMYVLRAASLSETELFDSVTTRYTFIPTLPSLTQLCQFCEAFCSSNHGWDTYCRQ